MSSTFSLTTPLPPFLSDAQSTTETSFAPCVVYYFPYETAKDKEVVRNYIAHLEQSRKEKLARIKELVAEITQEQLRSEHGGLYDDLIAAEARKDKSSELSYLFDMSKDSFQLSPEVLGPRTPSTPFHAAQKRRTRASAPSPSPTSALKSRASAAKRAKKTVVSPPTTRITRSAARNAMAIEKSAALALPATPTASGTRRDSDSTLVAGSSSEVVQHTSAKAASSTSLGYFHRSRHNPSKPGKLWSALKW